MSTKANPAHRRDSPANLDAEDIERLIKLPAWERAKVYDAANLGLGDRSLIELEVRVRIAAQHRRRRR